MKKPNSTPVRIGFLIVVVFLAFGTTVFGQGSLNDAKTLMDKGQFRLADAVFQAMVQKDNQNPDTWYWWGICNLRQGYQGDRMFLKAVGLKPKYAESVASLYQREAEVFLQNGRIDQARAFFDKTIEWDKGLRPKIASYLFDSGHYDLAVRYNAGLADRVADIFFAKGETFDGEAALEYYREAKKYSAKHNKAIKDKLLAVSKTKFEEDDIRFWRNAAKEFGSIPPDYKIYEPGTYTFSLKAGEKLDHWIMFPEGMLLGLSITTTDYNCKILFDDGEVIKDGKNVAMPSKIRQKFKLIAITDQPEIVMVVRDNGLTQR